VDHNAWSSQLRVLQGQAHCATTPALQEVLLSLDRLFVETSKRCTIRGSSETQPFDEPSYHMPSKVCLDFSADGIEPALVLQVHHTHVTVEATLRAPLAAIQALLPATLLHVHEAALAPVPEVPRLRLLVPPPGFEDAMAATLDAAGLVSFRFLLKAVDNVLVEASQRCTCRGRDNLQVWHNGPAENLHMPNRICVESGMAPVEPGPGGDGVPGAEQPACQIFVRHSNVTVSLVLMCPAAFLQALFPQEGLIHMHEGADEAGDDATRLALPAHLVDVIKKRAVIQVKEGAADESGRGGEWNGSGMGGGGGGG
jgi:hypothetical protein